LEEEGKKKKKFGDKLQDEEKEGVAKNIIGGTYERETPVRRLKTNDNSGFGPKGKVYH